MRRCRLRRDRDRLILPHGALAGVGDELKRLRGVQRMANADATLRLLQIFSGVELHCEGIHRSRIGAKFGARQPQRVLRAGQVDVIADDGDGGGFAHLYVELCVCTEARGSALRPWAISVKTIDLGYVANSAFTSVCFDADAQRIVRACCERGGNGGRRNARFGEHLNHAASRVAVQRGKRPA